MMTSDEYTVYSYLDVIVPDQCYQEHVLHEDYCVLLSYTEDDWRKWVVSGQSRLLTCVPLIQIHHQVWSRPELRRFLRERDFEEEIYYQYVTSDFIVNDWDFEEEHWDYWESSCEEDIGFWGHLFRPIKQKTADLQKLNSEICGQYPFAELPTLAASIEDRFENEIVDSKGVLCELKSEINTRYGCFIFLLIRIKVSATRSLA